MPRFRYALTLMIAAFGSASGGAQPSDEAATYYGGALEIIEKYHINSLTADWPAIKARGAALMKDARTTADTHAAIGSVLEDLGERHSFLLKPRAPERTSAGPTPREGDPESLPVGRLAEPGIALVRLPPLDTSRAGGAERGSLYKAALKDFLTRIDAQPLCGWIIDLRRNGGGDMWPMLQGLDPLLGEPPFGFFLQRSGGLVPWVRTPDGVGSELELQPGVPPSFSLRHQQAPIAILIGPHTASSGEMTALALIGRPNVRTFGAPSSGYTSGNMPFDLADGATLLLTVVKVRDRTGRDYSGPIVPDEKTRPEDDERAAIRWLRSQCPTA